MKNRIYRFCISAVMIASLSASLGACAKTPDESIVKQKNVDRLREEAKKTPDESSTLKSTVEEAPAHYDYSYENKDKSLVVKADADVWLPDKDTIPMYDVTGDGFSQDFATAAYNFFFKGKETYTLGGTDMTKAKVQEMILACKQSIAEAEDDTEMSDVDRQGYIDSKNTELEYWQAQYEDAPEKSTLHKIPKDDKIELLENCVTENDKDKVYGVECQTDDDEYFSLENCPIDSSGWSAMLYSRKSKWNYSGENGEELNTDKLKESAQKDIGISVEEAKAKADSFFDAVGVDVRCMAILGMQGFEIIEGSNDKKEDDYETKTPPTDYTAYQFTYTRMIDSIPVACTTNDYLPDDDAALTWCYERVKIIVDKDGIVSVSWEFPTNMKESVSDNVGIISFEKAKETFEKMMPIVYEGKIQELDDENTKHTYDISVNQVCLSLMRVRDSGSKREGVYSPTWIFYGDVAEQFKCYNADSDKWTDGDILKEEAPWIVLAINAVDGSVIDVVEGY